MPFKIVRNDITRVAADAIVNTANPEPCFGSGTDAAVYQAAGAEKMLAARKTIGRIAPGECAVTPAFGLPAKYVIHTVGPAWNGGSYGEFDILRSCYRNSLLLADQLGCESIAFPLIATGVYGFPKEEALNIAMSEIEKFLLTSEMNVILVVFDRKALKLSEKLTDDIQEYIDEHTVGRLRRLEYRDGQAPRTKKLSAISQEMYPESEEPENRQNSIHRSRMSELRQEESLFSAEKAEMINFPSAKGKSLEEMLNTREDTFQQRLLKLIDARGLDDVTVYKSANISRKLFSKIRSNTDYKPKKKTAVAFAIALHLNMPEMIDLLARAEIAFSPSSKFDLIISYFVENKKYNIHEINIILFDNGQQLLGDVAEI